MRSAFPTCAPDDRLADVAQRVEHTTEPVVVVDAEGNVAGVLPPREVERARLGATEEPVAAAMSSDWIRCEPGDDARHLGARLLLTGAPAALVLDGERPIGVVTVLALGRAMQGSRHSHRRVPPHRRGDELTG